MPSPIPQLTYPFPISSPLVLSLLPPLPPLFYLAQMKLTLIQLRPYVFAPDDPTPLDRHRRSEARQAALEAGEPDPDPQLVKFPAFYPRAKDYAAGPNGGQAFAKWYRGLREEERQAMIMETRRRWWEGMVRRFGRASHAEEVEGSEGDGSQQAGPSDGSEKPGGL